MQQIYRRTPKCDLNKVAFQLRVSPVNLLHIFRTLFYNNKYGGLPQLIHSMKFFKHEYLFPRQFHWQSHIYWTLFVMMLCRDGFVNPAVAISHFCYYSTYGNLKIVIAFYRWSENVDHGSEKNGLVLSENARQYLWVGSVYVSILVPLKNLAPISSW